MARRKRKSSLNVVSVSKSNKVSLANCEFFLDPGLRSEVHRFPFSIPIAYEADSLSCKFASLDVSLPCKINIKLAATGKLYLCYGKGPELFCILYWKKEFPKDNEPKDYACLASYDLPFEVSEALRNQKKFSLIWNCDAKSGIMKIEVYLNKNIIMNLDHASEVINGRINTDVQTVVSFFTGIYMEDYQDILISDEELVKTIYNLIGNHYNADNKVKEASHNFLIPQLRDYQKQAVSWMLNRELEGIPRLNIKGDLHPLYIKFNLYDRVLFYNKYCGIFSETFYKCPPAIRGGVLADEMGLGKTVEVLACVLLNPMIKDLSAIENSYADDRQIASSSSSSTMSLMPQTYGTAKRKRYSAEIPSTSAKRTQSDNFQCAILKDVDTLPDGLAFECVCGTNNSKQKCNTLVVCKNCRLVQHTACVLNDPMEICNPYICPYCWVNEEPVTSRATLIVSPASIIKQWEEEIRKHIIENTLKVFMYHGIQHDKFLQPPILADNDIVLIAYETLRKEVDHVNITRNKGNSYRNLRYPKKFASIPTPLTKIHWWRICLDEAQMVESVTTKISTMALQLSAVNRWCVTGTPIQKSIEDLYGLLLFLGYDPLYEKFWWKELILKPAANGDLSLLVNVINEVIWRTTKTNVLEQIGLPQLNIRRHMLDFSAVEKAFYDQHHRQCKHEFFSKVVQYDCAEAKLNSLNHNLVGKLLQPFRKLRQACCHPQLVRGEFSVTKSTITMPQLLASMIKKAKNACEESQRQHIASLNGLAGMYIIKEDFPKALETYEKVLSTIESNFQFFRADRLQLFHTYFNLVQILKSIYCPESEDNEHGRIEVEESVKIHFSIDYMNELKLKAEELYSGYINRHISFVASAKDNLDSASNQVKEIEEQFQFPNTSPWWNEVISFFSGVEEIFCERVKNELCRCDYESAACRFNSCAGLKYIITVHSNCLKSKNELVSRLIGQLSLTPTPSEVCEATCCHLRPVRGSVVKCVYCSIDKKLKQYENTLFRRNDIAIDERRHSDHAGNQVNNFIDNETHQLNDGSDEISKKENVVVNPHRHGTWADSELEIILKCVLNIAKNSPGVNDFVEDGINHLKLFDSLKKEFKCLRSLWMRIVDFASCIDETEMGKLRMRVQEPNEAPPNSNNPNVIKFYEVDSTLQNFESEAMQYQNELKTKMGHMFYLENLSKTDESSPISSQLCPVCRSQFGHIWSVLSCCHSVCEVCIQVLLTQYSVGRLIPAVQCPECRKYTNHTDIKHVHSTREEMSVKGSWSTKVTGIINCLNQIAADDSTAKTLVFCNWANFIGVLEQSLELNEIPFISLGKKKNFHENLAKFKHDPSINVLLLQYNAGANGLNIIEASHIILVEPSLEYAVVQQAIGRIHRIGQTKEMTVHQFVVNDTIEENIFEFERPFLFAEIPHEMSSLTVKNIMNLFEKT